MNYNEQVWEEYLSSRPNFNKWCHYCLNSKKHDYLSSRFSFMQNMIETGGKTEHGRKVTDLTDGEALAYFMYPYIDVGLVLAESKAIKPFQPSINFDEAKYMDDNSTIATWVDFLCTRELDGDSTSEEYWNDIRFAGDLLETIDKYESHHIPHMVWDTVHDLIRTVIECNNDYCRLFEARCNKVIDSDYLDHYLLAPKMDPTDIDKDTWHRMSVKLIKWLDEDNRKTQSQSTRFFKNDLLGFMSDGLASCFLTHNLEDLSFMKTVYDFCASIPHYKFRSMRKSYRPGMLNPELFDLLREHEAVFVRPLLEQALQN